MSGGRVRDSQKVPLGCWSRDNWTQVQPEFWYSHPEPSFDLHNFSCQTAPVQTQSSEQMTYFDSFSACEDSRPISGQLMFSRSCTRGTNDVYTKHVMTNFCLVTTALKFSRVQIDVTEPQEYIFCLCFEVKGQSYWNRDTEVLWGQHAESLIL